MIRINLLKPKLYLPAPKEPKEPLFFKPDLLWYDEMVLGLIYIFTGLVAICTLGHYSTYLGIRYLIRRGK